MHHTHRNAEKHLCKYKQRPPYFGKANGKGVSGKQGAGLFILPGLERGWTGGLSIRSDDRYICQEEGKVMRGTECPRKCM